jgi:Ca-activated chloride channel family protein
MIPLAFLIFWSKSRDGGRVYFSDLKWLKLTRKGAHSSRILLNLLRGIAFLLMVVALARPSLGKKFTQTESSGVDIFLTIDTSGSMQALDFILNGKRVDRLSAIKKVAREFIENRPYDRLGLVVFGAEAYTQCPLTLDHAVLLDFVDRSTIGMAGDETAIGSAMGVTISRMKKIDTKSKVIILLTDGTNNYGELEPLKAAAIAKTEGIKIYTIGIGSHGAVPFPEMTPFGPTMTYVRMEMDEKLLQEIANTTGGSYFRATATAELTRIYEQIDQMEKSDVKVNEYTEYIEMYFYFLWAALIILVIEILLANTWLRKLP